MQNANNLYSLAGKRSNQAKKAKKKATQQPAFWARPAGAKNVKVQARAPSNLLEVKTSKSFQAPHHQQESMDDLIDDNSPNIPLPSGSWKPISGSSDFATDTTFTTEPQSNNIKMTPKRQEKWQKFQESLQKKIEAKAVLIEESKKRLTWVRNMDATVVKQEPEMSENQSGQELHWELNMIDEKEEPKIPVSIPPQATNKPTIVQKSQSPLVQEKLPIIMKTPKPPQKPLLKLPQKSPQTPPLPQMETVPSTKPVQYNMMTPQKTMQAKAPAGVPRTFMIKQPSLGVLGAIRPQLTDTGRCDVFPSWPSNIMPASDIYEQYVSSAPMHIERQMYVHTNIPEETPQQYSPSDVYDESIFLEHDAEYGSESDHHASQKRLSAFQRLGPVTSAKKPKLTINLCIDKDQSVREVVDETVEEEKYEPVHLRKDMLESKDETVIKFLPSWPWKRNVTVRRSVTARASKTVMLLEQEQMEEIYDRDNGFFQVSVKGYPPHWKKEQVLDVIIESVKGKSFIPCFTEFTQEECKFLVIRSRPALIVIHKYGFCIRKADIELCVTISHVDLGLNQIDFIPRLVLRKRLAQGYDGERKLNLREFTSQPDISHFLYFPLNRPTNQTELIELQSIIAWDFLTDLDLSHNRIASIDSLNLEKTTPKLQNLDLSYNCIERVTSLLRCRVLSLRSLKLEGNPLCTDYTDPRHYVRVIRMIFPTLVEIDGLPIHLKGDMPPFKKNYCPEAANHLVEKFLEVFFPLLDMSMEDRLRIKALYDEKAVVTITFRYNLRNSPSYRFFRNLFFRARVFEEGETESIEGASAITKLISKWPPLHHDPHTFTVDVMHHNDFTTILRISGIVKVIAESLAEEEPLLAFTRTIVLSTRSGAEYKILNEMVYWEQPTEAYANSSFQRNTIRSKKLSLKFEGPPDEDLKEKITDIFMEITGLDRKASERCLELKDWNVKITLEYFMKLVKLDDLSLLKTQEC